MPREKKITLPPLVRAARLDEAALLRDCVLTDDATLHRAYVDLALGGDPPAQPDGHNVCEAEEVPAWAYALI